MNVTNKGKKMSKQATALDMIKSRKDKGGMTTAQLRLAEAQSEDYSEMKQQVQEIKQKVEVVEQKVDNVEIQLASIKGSVDIILENSRYKSKLIENKYFWATIMLLLVLIAGINHLSDLIKLFGG